MASYVLRRVLIAVPVLVAVSCVIFVIMRVAPGDVASMLLSDEDGGRADPAAVEALRQQLGLNRPYHVQYWDFIAGMVRLDPGTSLWTGKPVMSLLASRVALTFELALLALILSLIIAIVTGVLSAVYHDRLIDHVFRVLSVGALAVPHFWLGTLILLALALWFQWTPPLGYTTFREDPVRNLQQLFWPAVVVGYSNAAVISRMMRSAMLEVLREDYVRTAAAKGLRRRTVILRHALQNALLPVVTLASLQFGHLLGGAVISETVFNLPGVGRFLVDAIYHRDYPVVQTVVVMSAVIFVFVNLVVDILYGWLDPRIRYS